MVGRFKRVLLLFIIPLFLLVFAYNAKADEIEIKDFKIANKTDDVYVESLLFNNNEVKNNITFNKVDDYITFEFVLNNTSKSKYTIEKIKDNNSNEHFNIEYGYDNKEITSGKSSIINIKISYSKLLKNVEEEKLNNLMVTIILIKDNGTEEEIVVPITGDNIKISIIELVISIILLTVILIKTKINKRKKIIVITLVLLSPLMIFASEQVEVNILFNELTVKGEFDILKVNIDKDNGEEIEVVERRYNSTIGDIPKPEKRGYSFVKWVDENNNEVTKNKVVTEEITIKAVYEVINYHISYVLNGGTPFNPNPNTYNVESSITLVNPMRTGYNFSGWTRNDTTTKELEGKIEPGTIGDLVFTANFDPKDQDYDVVYFTETMYDTIYEIKETDHLVAKTDEEVEANPKDIAGFKYNSSLGLNIKSGVIPTTGKLELRLYYDRSKYTVSYSYTNETIPTDATVLPSDKQYKFESNVEVFEDASAPGYTFSGWNRTGNFSMPSHDVSITGTLIPKTNTPYKVEHYFETFNDGEFVIDNELTDSLTGTTDVTITAQSKTVTGFTFDEDNSNNVKSGAINGYGTLVLKLYYTRNRYNVTYGYTNTVIPTDATELPETKEYKFDSDVTVAPNATATGYTFSGWDRTGTFKMPNEKVDIKGTFTPNTYTIIFDKNDSSITTTMPDQQMTYDVEANLNANTYQKGGYHFTKWTTNSNGTGTEYLDKASVKNLATSGTITLYANYEPDSNTTYKVEHYLETLTDGVYEIDNELTDTKSGETDTTANAVSKTVTGFTYDEDNSNNIKSGVINGEGSLVLKLYYSRNEYDLSYRYTDENVPSNASELPATKKYKYEQEVTVADPATAQGYVFSGWSRTGKFNMPAENVEITGSFSVGTSSYKIEHYGQDVNGNYVLLTTETENLTGETNSHVVGTFKDVENHTYTELNHTTYSYNPLHPDQVSEGTIKPDGSLTLKFYYYRNKYELHIINETNVSGASSDRYFYGTQLTLVANPRDEADEAFTKWSDGVTDTLTRTIEITGDTTIGPYYHIYTVTLISKDPRTTVATTTEIKKVDPGNSLVLPELSKDECVYPKDATHQTPQERECSFLAEFLGWYLDDHYTQKVESPYTPTDDVTLYAKWNGVYYHYRISGVREYSGTAGDYDDSGIVLYNSDNINRDFEINFDLIEYGKSSFEQPTVMNGKYEKKSLNYPGFVVRFNPGNSEGWTKMQVTSRWGTTTTERYINHSDLWLDPAEADKPLHVKITRINGVVKATYSTEYEGTSISAQGTTITLFDQNASNGPNLPDNVPTTVTFGATVNEQGIPMRFFKGKLANIEVIMTSDMY